MSPTKHLPFEKFEAIDMSLHDAVVLWESESRFHREQEADTEAGEELGGEWLPSSFPCK